MSVVMYFLIRPARDLKNITGQFRDSIQDADLKKRNVFLEKEKYQERLEKAQVLQEPVGTEFIILKIFAEAGHG